jgi:hypothetical protein
LHPLPPAFDDDALMLYDDGLVALDDNGVLIRRYYPWGHKRIPYGAIRSFERLPIRVRKWRLWGSGDLVHWWNLDPHRPKKDVAIVIDVGKHIRPTITPDEPETVERLLNEKTAP